MNTRHRCFNTFLIICFMFLSSCAKHKQSAPSSIPQFQELQINSTDITRGVFYISTGVGNKYYVAFNGDTIFSSTSLNFSTNWPSYSLKWGTAITGNILYVAPFYKNSLSAPQLIVLTNADAGFNLYICNNLGLSSMSCSAVSDEIPVELKQEGLRYFGGNNGINYAVIESTDQLNIYDTTADYSFVSIIGLAPFAIKTAQTAYDINVDKKGVAYFLIPSSVNDRTDLFEYNPGQGTQEGQWTEIYSGSLVSSPIVSDGNGNLFYINSVGTNPSCNNKGWQMNIGVINKGLYKTQLVNLPITCDAPIIVKSMSIDDVNNIYITVSQNGVEKVYKVNIAV
jgi:hypothetical protein